MGIKSDLPLFSTGGFSWYSLAGCGHLLHRAFHAICCKNDGSWENHLDQQHLNSFWFLLFELSQVIYRGQKWGGGIDGGNRMYRRKHNVQVEWRLLIFIWGMTFEVNTSTTHPNPNAQISAAKWRWSTSRQRLRTEAWVHCESSQIQCLLHVITWS